MASFPLEERGRLSITYGGGEGGKWRECGENVKGGSFKSLNFIFLDFLIGYQTTD